ncbi:MAG TPA: hypothetical protein VGF51_05035 [Acidimicrobiales bacterium]|jgi:hypothetical protein
MVLVAPRPLQRPTSGAVAVAAGAGAGAGGAAGGASGGAGGAGGGEVLTLLRDTSARPSFDPGLAGGLRAWLEDAAYGVVASRGELAPPLVLGPREVLGQVPTPVGAGDAALAGGGGGGGDRGMPSEEIVVSRLVHALFRRLVVDGALDDPLGDALDACRAEGPRGTGTATVASVEAMDEPARAALATVVATHAAHLSDLVPRFAPAWMPRTDDRVAIPLAGGRVVLHGVFDLIVGLPRPDTASVCALGLCTGGSWARERRSLHYLALLETLRSGTPPFRLALLETGSGRYGIEDVRDEHLRAMASHLAAWLGAVADGGGGGDGTPGGDGGAELG